MRIDLHVHTDSPKSDAILALLTTLAETLIPMTAALDRIRADIAALTSVDQSAITLIQGLAQQVRDSADDPAALAKLADDIEAQSAALAAAVAANTPASSSGGDASASAGGDTTTSTGSDTPPASVAPAGDATDTAGDEPTATGGDDTSGASAA